MEGGSPPAKSTIVAVVPFGAVVEGGADEDTERPGRWARQIARRLVDRFAGEETLEVRPVILVAMPETSSQAGYLVFGSTPDASLAARYARSLGATHALTGTYRESPTAGKLEAALVDAGGHVVATFARDIAEGGLHLVEPALATWLASALGVTAEHDLAAPVTVNSQAYETLLVGMDAEVDATLLRESDPKGASAAIARAAAAYTLAAHADPAAAVVEERILLMAASAIENDQQALVLEPLETLAETRPASWRLQYMLGEVRRTSGDLNGAIVAFEHADALQPLRPGDSLTLAQLQIAAGAPAVAAARLRRIVRGGAEAPVAATARRLLLGVRHPELEKDLETAGKIAVDGQLARAAEAEAAFDRVLAAEPDLWEAHFGRGLLARQRGDADAAQASFQRAIDLNPAAAELVKDLGTVGERAGRARGRKGAKPPAKN
ncbi:MAG: tetratricopeptide repeat protein [Chloroflexi bacterium]|nr:tetratricopeptide repeat protein [Chloroflexota bacterium]